MKRFKRENRFHYLYVILVVIFILLFTEVLFRYYSDEHYESHTEELESYVQKSAQLIQESLMRKIYAVDTLKVMLELTDYDISQFEVWAPRIFEVEPGIASIQLAPNGIVTSIYPLSGNEKALGHNLLEDKNRDDGAKLTIESEEIVFVGPINLIQNGKRAIISRRPIFIGEGSSSKFWGFATVVINIEDIKFDNFIESDLYNYRIVGLNPDRVDQSIIDENCDGECDFESQSIISLPGGQWIIKMSLKETHDSTVMHVTFYVFGVLGALLFARFNTKKHKQSIKIKILNKELEKLSHEDILTGCHNRRYFEESMTREQSKANRYKLNLSMILFDIDFFKEINDNNGHHMGDLVLKEIVELMTYNVRAGDEFARWGGEEFVILLPSINADEALKVAEKLRQIIENHKFVNDFHVTASFGVSEYIHGESDEIFFKRVDDAVYQAKEQGRNQVVLNR